MSRYFQKCFYFADVSNGLNLLFKPLNSEQQLTYMWFLWSGAESDTSDWTDVWSAIKTLKMKLENLYAVENISMSLQPPPGKLAATDLIGSSFYRFFVPFL